MFWYRYCNYSVMRTDRVNIILLLAILVIAITGCEIYPLEDPSADERDQLTGMWTCTEYSEENNAFTYPVNIKKDPGDENKIILENFGFIGFDEKPPYGVLNGNGISLPKQTVCDDASITISGNATFFNNKTINWEYQIEIGGDIYKYVATLTKNN